MGKPISDELLVEAFEAVELHGSAVEAARVLKLPITTVKDRVRLANERLGLGKMKEKSKINEYQERVKALEKIVALQHDRIEASKKAQQFVIPKSKKAKKTGAFCRIIIPDTHGCYTDWAALSAVMSDLESMSESIQEVVFLGDHLDCGGFLSQHFTIGYVAEADYSYEEDVAATNTMLDKLQKVCGGATYHYLEGNHERRVEKWAVTQALRHKRDAAYLRKLVSAETVLSLGKRGVKLYQQGQCYDGMRIPSTIRLGQCSFTHGSRTGESPAKLMLKDFGGNVVFGHTHRMDSYASRSVQYGEMGAWCPGCLCRLQPLWQHTQVTSWVHGYGLQLVRQDGGFLHINVPIIDGESYLVHLTSRMAG